MIARTLSTIVIVSAILYCLAKPDLHWIVKIIGALLVFLGALETTNLVSKVKLRPFYFISITASILIFLDAAFLNFSQFLPLIVFVIIAPFIWQMAKHKEQNAIGNISGSIFSSLYASLPIGLFFYIMNKIPDKSVAVAFGFYVLIVVWMTDSGAYLVGTFFGKHKMAPRLSPKKTMEGAVGGLVGGGGGGILFFHLSAMNGALNHGILEAFILSIVLSLFCQIGDLAESALKRDAGVKDSGRTYTGHGGALDMVDGLLFCIPALYLHLRWFYPQYNL